MPQPVRQSANPNEPELKLKRMCKSSKAEWRTEKWSEEWQAGGWAGWEGSWIGGCLRCRQESRSKHEINPHRQRELQLRCLQCLARMKGSSQIKRRWNALWRLSMAVEEDRVGRRYGNELARERQWCWYVSYIEGYSWLSLSNLRY